MQRKAILWLCVDAVGMEANRNLLDKLSNIVHAQAGSIKALHTAISAVRRGGVVAVVGVYGMPYDNFPLGQIFDKGITLRLGQAPVQKYIDELLTWVEERKIRLDDIISHRGRANCSSRCPLRCDFPSSPCDPRVKERLP
jgi:S-(hydroxymethyl)glutathione dehydrogenase / alcohol dehydrogenase